MHTGHTELSILFNTVTLHNTQLPPILARSIKTKRSQMLPGHEAIVHSLGRCLASQTSCFRFPPLLCSLFSLSFIHHTTQNTKNRASGGPTHPIDTFHFNGGRERHIHVEQLSLCTHEMRDGALQMLIIAISFLLPFA